MASTCIGHTDNTVTKNAVFTTEMQDSKSWQQTRKRGSCDALQLEAVRHRASRSGPNASAYQHSAQSGWTTELSKLRPFSEGSQWTFSFQSWVEQTKPTLQRTQNNHGCLQVPCQFPFVCPLPKPGDWSWKIEAKFCTFHSSVTKLGKWWGDVSEWIFQA